MMERSDEISGGCSKSRSAEATARRQSKQQFCECGCPSNHHGLASWDDAGCENSSCAGKCLRSYESFQPDPVAYEAKIRERKKLILEGNWFELCKAAEHENMQLRRELENIRASETRLREGLRELVEKLELLDKSEELKSIFVFAHVHGMVYAGPNWEKELKAGRALLSLEGDKTAGVAASPEAKHGESSRIKEGR